jgi:hypothetical protein
MALLSEDCGGIHAHSTSHHFDPERPALAFVAQMTDLEIFETLLAWPIWRPNRACVRVTCSPMILGGPSEWF